MWPRRVRGYLLLEGCGCLWCGDGLPNNSLDRSADPGTLHAQDLALTQLTPAPGQLKRSAQQFLVIKMGFGIAILLSDKKLPTESYLSFVNACSSLFGHWDINELAPINLNAETVHDFTIVTGTTNETRQQVWVTLERREFTKKFGQGRRQIFWQIYIETKAGRGPQSLALQFLLPLRAFRSFVDPVVLVEFDPERVFLERNNYEAFAKREIARACGEEFLANLALDVVTPNNSSGRVKTKVKFGVMREHWSARALLSVVIGVERGMRG